MREDTETVVIFITIVTIEIIQKRLCRNLGCKVLIHQIFRVLKEAEKRDKLREKEAKQQQFMEEKKRKQEEKQEEKIRKLQEIEMKRQQNAIVKEQVSFMVSIN